MKWYWITAFGEIEESSDDLIWKEDLRRYGNYFEDKRRAIEVRNQIYRIFKNEI